MLRLVPNADALIATVLAAGEVQDRQADLDRAEALGRLVARKPSSRPTVRSTMIEMFGFTAGEAQFFDKLRSQYGYSATEAARIVTGDRKKSNPTGEGI